VGQTQQELPGRSGSVIDLRCTRCGEPLAGAVIVTAVLRGVVYEYCDDDCRDAHAVVVALQPARCGLCDLDAVGDTGRCAAHLDGDGTSGAGGYPLAG
jgi:hypothetical protein